MKALPELFLIEYLASLLSFPGLGDAVETLSPSVQHTNLNGGSLIKENRTSQYTC